MDDDPLYGPFLDEEFFYYYDKTIIELEHLEVYENDVGFIGLDRLQQIYALGKDGSFDNVMFSGRMTLDKTGYLCERGLKQLLQQVQKKDPAMDAYKLQKACRQGKIKVELLCQLALMPVCYLTKRPAHSIMIYSKNQNNFNNQRRYVVKTFHIVCFRRSQLTFHRYYVLKFVIDACNTYGHEVPREDRDVHWLVKVYFENYSAVFDKYDRPKLHRAEVYDHFATHAEWLKSVFAHKILVDRGKWAEWVDQVKRLKNKKKRNQSKWGRPMTAPVRPRRPQQRAFLFHSDSELDGANIDYRDIIVNIPSSDKDTSVQDSSSESESDGDVQYAHVHDSGQRLLSRAHRGLLLPMPSPTWHWTCDITRECPFVIDIGNRRRRDAPCMASLSERQKDYIIQSKWGLFDKKLINIWKIMCQAHMDWHWREAGLVLDHERRLIYGVEEEDAN